MAMVTTGDDRRPEAVVDAVTFLQEHPHVYLLGRRPDGLPTGWAMTAQADRGHCDFSTYAASAKVRLLLREGVAQVLAFDEDAGGRGRVLVAGGPVRLLDGSARIEAPEGAEPAETERPSVPADVVAKVRDRHRSGKRVVLRVNLEHARFSRAPWAAG